MPKTKPSYSAEFKREVLAYQASTGQSPKEVADHFGITTNSLRTWQRQAPDPGVANESPEAELRRLRRENRELQMSCEILKNGGHLQRPVRERFALIQAMKNDYPVTLLSETLEVSRSGYHAWAGGRRNVRERCDVALRPKLRVAFDASGQT